MISSPFSVKPHPAIKKLAFTGIPYLVVGVIGKQIGWVLSGKCKRLSATYCHLVSLATVLLTLKYSFSIQFDQSYIVYVHSFVIVRMYNNFLDTNILYFFIADICIAYAIQISFQIMFT